MEREWSCYRGGNFNGGRMVMLQKRSLCWRGNGHTEVVLWRENGHVTEVVFNGGQYRGQYNGGRIVMLRRWPV